MLVLFLFMQIQGNNKIRFQQNLITDRRGHNKAQ